MPNINEVLQNREQKKFVKKNYRPWDLTGEATNNLLDNVQEEYAANSSDHIVNIQDSEKSVETILDNNKVTIREQLENVQETIEKQLDNIKTTNKEQIDNNEKTGKVTIEEQLGNILDPTTLYNRIINLSGLQRSILELVADLCSINGNLETGPIETATIALYIKTSLGSVKTSINRLIEKNILIRKKGRTAKGGYLNLSIIEEALCIIEDQRKKFHKKEKPIDVVISIRQQLDNKYSYINSSNFNKTITNTEKKESYPKEWETIDCEMLSEIGFTKNHLKQLINKTDPEIVQESINHFAFGLEHNQKIKQYENPLNVLMGVLRKGQVWFEKDYRSPKEIAQQKLLETKKAEIERKKALEEEAYKIAFSEWQDQLSENEKEQIAPNKKDFNDLTPRTVKLSTYFKENIWPSKKNEYTIF